MTDEVGMPITQSIPWSIDRSVRVQPWVALPYRNDCAQFGRADLQCALPVTHQVLGLKC